MRSLLNKVDLKVAVAPVVLTDNTVVTGITIDRLSFESVLFAIALGTLADADATFAVKVQEGDLANASDMADVAAVDLDGTVALASFQFDSDLLARKIAYCGQKRYCRLVITPAANSGNAPVSALAVLGHPHSAATVNPPV